MTSAVGNGDPAMPVPPVEDASLHSGPDLTCEVVDHLPILTNVRVATMATVSGRDDKRSRWVFVDAGDRAGARNGWLVEERIGYAGRFTLRFPACFDGLGAEPNGEAKCPSEEDVRQEEDGLIHCVSKGDVFRAGDVIRMGGPESFEHLYFNGSGATLRR
ncbi:MAG: hypothetical protein OXG51_16100 [Gammaproteobacteria bacterium]|nr:hypothetical protein [Gammaproteobacteria bacterium]